MEAEGLYFFVTIPVGYEGENLVFVFGQDVRTPCVAHLIARPSKQFFVFIYIDLPISSDIGISNTRPHQGVLLPTNLVRAQPAFPPQHHGG